MFEFLFKYPSAIFSRGTFVFAMAGRSGCCGRRWRRPRRRWRCWSGGGRAADSGPAAVWLLQTLWLRCCLFMLWHPALSVATLRPQQNIVAVVVDDSASMAHADEGGATRKDAAVSVLNSGLLNALQDKFQVRLYRMSDHLERIDKLEQLTASAPATHIGESLKQVVADAASLPIGAVVLLSDGADNSGGIDLETISEIRRQRIPVHTIGFGREQAWRTMWRSPTCELAPRALCRIRGWARRSASISMATRARRPSSTSRTAAKMLASARMSR